MFCASNPAFVHRDPHDGPAGEAGGRERLPGENICLQPGRAGAFLQRRGAGAEVGKQPPQQEPQAL